MAQTGVRLRPEEEDRVAAAIPALSAALEDGPRLWVWLRRILCGRYAGDALRSMHALGLLDLIVPEFHGIDALVVRDAYHRKLSRLDASVDVGARLRRRMRALRARLARGLDRGRARA